MDEPNMKLLHGGHLFEHKQISQQEDKDFLSFISEV